ncbi:hypothetical protein L3Q82_002651 [Scortum barcoo]|uniref:Uncharacterized protein n=1 Tax=Scortum barcoo TaxID=214431 RepID=A0ACB8VX63_9TELE|nr:hypothetical protein L3Q82_002651 [Scortum barcoo]
MLVRALLQTSLVLWLAQQTLQGGVKPQSVSWGRVLPARGVGIGVKPGVAGALGALGSRYGSKAMKTGIGRYPGAQLGVGGYRALGLGGRAGLKQGGHGTQLNPYGASLGTGMGLGTGLTNGVGLGQGGKRVYGAGHGALPGYGALAGIGYPGARPEDLGGPELAKLGQALQDLKRKKSGALGPLYGKRDNRRLEMPSVRGSDVLGPTAPELQAETGFRPAAPPPGSLNPIVQSSNLGPMMPLDKQTKGLGLDVSQGGGSYDPTALERRGATSYGASLADGGVRQQLPLNKDDIRSLGSSQVQSARDYNPPIQPFMQAKNCGSARDLEINRHELLEAETQRAQDLVAQLQVGKDSKHLGRATPQGKSTYGLPFSQTQDVSGSILQGQATRSYLSAAADRQGVKDLGLVAKDTNRPRIQGTVAVENHGHGSLNLPGGGSHGLVIPGTSRAQTLGIASVEAQEAKDFTADGREAKPLPLKEHDVAKLKALSVPGQTGRKTQGASYVGGAGNYLGTSLGAGGYGAGLGQGAYLGGAAGKLGAAAALGQGGYPQGYGEGATGYLGAMAGNGFGGDAGAKTLSTGYGNGYSDGYGAALSTGGYAGQVQGAYGALGAGLESTAGKYGGGAGQVPYGNAPVIPTGLEGDGGYPYNAQQLALGAEGAKTANKYGEQPGKYGGVNGALGNGYKDLIRGISYE